MRVVFCVCFLLIQFVVVKAEDAPPVPSPRAEAVAKVGQALTGDIIKYARGGDEDFARLVEKRKLNEVDWPSLARDGRKEEDYLQGLALDLLKLKDGNEHAKALVEKYAIEQHNPTAATPAPSRADTIARIGRLLTVDIASYAKDGDADFSRLMEKHKLNETDWSALAKDGPKEERYLENVVIDILALKDRNEHARAIMRKYDIKPNHPDQAK